MSYDSDPDAQHILELWNERKGTFATQRKADEEALGLYLRYEEQDTNTPVGTDIKTKPLRVGIAGFAIDKNAAAMAGAIFMHVTARDRKDPKSQIHADQILEPFLGGALERSQIEEVLVPAIRHMWIFSRGIWNQYPIPALWSENGHLRELYGKYLKLTEEQVAADEANDDLEKQIKEVREEISSFKEAQFPMRMRLANPMNTWPNISQDIRHPEVVESRMMTKSQIEDEFGADAMPSVYKEKHSNYEAEVIDWANHEFSASIIPFSASGKRTKEVDGILRSWHHGLKANPYGFFEVGVQPTNDRGIRWKSILFDFKDSLETVNEILTDMRNIHRREAQTNVVVGFDPVLRQQDPKVAGNANNIDIGPNEDGFIRVWKGETLTLSPTVTINPQSLELLKWLTDFVYQIVLNPTLLGVMKSGQSAVGFEAAKFAARENMIPYEKAVVKGLKHWAALVLRSVPRINKEFPKTPDPIVVVDEKYGRVAPSDEDVRGWEQYVLPRIKTPSSSSRMEQANLAVTLSNLTLHPKRILEMALDMEDATAEIDAWEEWQIEKILLGIIAQMVPQLAGAGMDQGGGTAQTANDLMGMSLPALEAMASNGVAPAQEAMGRSRQTAANVSRTGTPRPLSQTAAQEINV